MTEKVKGSMMRVTAELLEDLKVLKEAYSTKGKSLSNGELAQLLVSDELKNVRVKTQEGYLREGSVVMGPANKPVVIRHIEKDKVVFSDHTCLVNGSKTCYALTLLANSVDEYDGGFFNE